MRNRVITTAEYAAMMALIPTNNQRKVSAADVREAFRPLYELTIDVNEPLIRQWIAEGSRSKGPCVRTRRRGLLPSARCRLSMWATRGEYWTVAEAFTPASGPLSGITLDVGDWIQSIGDPALGLSGWTIISGGLLTEDIANTLYQPLGRTDHPLMGFIAHAASDNEYTWTDLNIARPIWDPTVAVLGQWNVAAALAADGDISFDGVNLDLTEFDGSGQIGGQSIPQSAWLDGSSLIRFTDPSDANVYTEGRVVISSVSAIAGGITRYQMQLDSVVQGGSGIDFQSFGSAVNVQINKSPSVGSSVFHPGAHFLVIDDNRGFVPVTVPGIGGHTVHKGDVVVALDSDNDGIVDSWDLVPLVSSASNRPLVHVEQTAGIGPTGGGTATGVGTTVAWTPAQRAAAQSAGGVYVDVQVPTASTAGYLALTEMVAGGQSVVHWTEVLPTSRAQYFAAHVSQGTQVVDDPSNLTRANQIGVVFDGVNLSLMDASGVVGGITHALSTADAARITAQDVPGAVTGQRDDVYVNRPDGISWIHDGAAWVPLAVTPPPVVGTDVGVISMWPTTTAPHGSLLCNGQSFSGTTYPELALVLPSLRLPDLRGMFVRGYGATVGPSHGAAMLSRHAHATAQPHNNFRALENGNHWHYIDQVAWSGSQGGGPNDNMEWRQGRTPQSGDPATRSAGRHVHTIEGGDSETVPVHVVLAYIIKASAT